ncbi:hypothetical protein [Streptomyces virginiae]|uniref:hypothetical protein n=1 Tax=Streptomyces virginiae TaxID=1961 RepID=UPI003868A64C|nr:hypothetical protein OG253_00040 [Streptomyces virginiae]WTB27288.1 hypothetical protein OG253_40795 [Streptomyces virginiae]
MSTATDPQPQTPQQQPPQPPQQPVTDPLLTLCLVIVGVLVLATAGYMCVAHPSLTGPIATVATVAGALAAAVGVAVAVRRR